MTDIELLKAAAKAAGITIRAEMSDGSLDIGPDHDFWNPLRYDGDALRLAVRLHMSVFSNQTASWVASGMRQIVRAEELHEGTNPTTATRRAIVRAAAAMAKE